MILTYSFSAQALRKQGIYHNQKAFVGAQNKHIDVQQFCNEHGTIYAISSDFGDRMTTQHLD